MICRQVKSVLVPVDFSENTKLAISKALEFCQEGMGHSAIHLFHVQLLPSWGMVHFLRGYSRQQFNVDKRSLLLQLEQLKSIISQERPGIDVHCAITSGHSIQQSIAEKANSIAADLVVIGKRSHHSLLSLLNTVIPNQLAAATGIPVLTAKPGSFNQEIRTVVIPVGSEFPDSKLEMLAAFRSRSRPQIKLVFFHEDGRDIGQSRDLLLNTFRTFKSRFLNIVNYEVLTGSNKARALLKYCNKISADVLIVHAGSETRMGKWTNSHISDWLPPSSRTQVLAITQQGRQVEPA